MGNEDPDADVAEQQREAAPPEDAEEPVVDPGGMPSEANPADVAEQRVVVPEDDDYER
ncbi:hypothetical protein ACU61A_29230 [Pseudonocardia sichuanensis]|uniref:Uncharacterized protein n=1 Tax=Pseudonocardia kunmingensis TaxID=630975 RepID=A0A543DLH2_9PSEU|nr:hypothetical protein [Pseudonocardia kunmingensis]TQM10169.1 hypothetical protein FB558_5953 [Pseudonocardia kunmingensis]